MVMILDVLNLHLKVPLRFIEVGVELLNEFIEQGGLLFCNFSFTTNLSSSIYFSKFLRCWYNPFLSFAHSVFSFFSSL